MAIKNKLVLTFLILGIVLAGFFMRLSRLRKTTPTIGTSKLWAIQAIDTMKYSRDMAGQMLDSPKFDDLIEKQVTLVAKTGATHISIGTPYDNRFLPIIHRWVEMARKYGLGVWFRGNLSGWEGWFGYERIGREEHLRGIKAFIVNNGDLFKDGDLFSSCSECENGGPGDPRRTGDVEGYRRFLIEETAAVRLAMKQINKNIPANLNSMNGDVARLIMDRDTTAKLGGFVVIDHYVNTPEKLVSDIREIADKTGGKVVLGEYGVPIPDLHGNMTEAEQADWMSRSLNLLAREKSVVGINYWTGFGGSTKLWGDDYADRKAVSVLTSYFAPAQIVGQVKTFLGIPVVDASVESGYRQILTDFQGRFSLPRVDQNQNLTVSHPGYISVSVSPQTFEYIYLEPKSYLVWLRQFLFGK